MTKKSTAFSSWLQRPRGTLTDPDSERPEYQGFRVDAAPGSEAGVSGTFVRGSRASSQELNLGGSGEVGNAAQVLRGFLLGIAHQQSSPLGALLVSVHLMRDDIGKLLRQGLADEQSAMTALQYLQEDLEGALGIVERLRRLGEEVKNLARHASPADFDIRELVTLAAAVCTAVLEHRVAVQYQFAQPQERGGQSAQADSWVVSIDGLQCICALAEITKILVQTSEVPLKAIRIVTGLFEGRVRVSVEPQTTEPGQGERSTLARAELVAQVEVLIQGTNMRLLRDRTTEYGRVVLESIDLCIAPSPGKAGSLSSSGTA